MPTGQSQGTQSALPVGTGTGGRGDLSAWCHGYSTPFVLQCPDTPDPRDTCALNPLREPFARKECGILLSEVFESCHPVVSASLC